MMAIQSEFALWSAEASVAMDGSKPREGVIPLLKYIAKMGLSCGDLFFAQARRMPQFLSHPPAWVLF